MELGGSLHTCRIGGLPGRMNHGPELDKEEKTPQEGWGRELSGGSRDTLGWKPEPGEAGPCLGHFREACGGVEFIPRTKGVKHSPVLTSPHPASSFLSYPPQPPSKPHISTAAPFCSQTMATAVPLPQVLFPPRAPSAPCKSRVSD